MSYPFGFGARRARARTQALIAGLGKAPPDWSVTGDTNRTYFDRNGVLQTAAANEARVTYDPVTLLKRGVLNEPAATNEIRNNRMQGGGPGVLPTYWGGPSSINGIAREVISVGVRDGIEYTRFRFHGTATADLLGAAFVYLESQTQITAAKDETWTTSAYFASPAGTDLSGVTGMAVSTFGTNSGGGLVEKQGKTFTPTTNFMRVEATKTFASVNTAHAFPAYELTVLNGNTIDFEIEIGVPQIELGAQASSVIKTSGAAVTRAAETLSIATPALGEGTVHETTRTYEDDTTAITNKAVTSGAVSFAGSGVKAIRSVYVDPTLAA